ncbi:MAG: Sir2 family NAD-dependent protein deacetylase [Spirochaetota bacterium]|nr:MAG: Sir2 family NAD-dependent protein deacetylase [Spirochaetota bacterium]
MDASQKLVGYLQDARKILIFTGAGISTKSGIQDFRGPKGLWKTQQPVYYQDFMTNDDARTLYWKRKLDSWNIIEKAQPNSVHTAIVRLEHAKKLCMVVTQNIDGLHRRAGTLPELLVEMHGSMDQVECQSCHNIFEPAPIYNKFSETGNAPLCECGGYLKPATISFGQNLREDELKRAYNASNKADLVIALGSTLSVTPASTIPLLVAERGVPYVIVNKGFTEHDGHPLVSLRLEGDVGELFVPAVHAALSN